ncbi:hypothetical protein [Chryseobacterium sp. T20]|uniref:hypothetical protein n=1 Tax=Chryseobacterium sp. T20 TaxID=3395375 RepID=UPI0039BD182C
MQINEKIAELKNKLPLGSKDELVKRTELAPATIKRILDGKKARLKNIKLIIEEGEKILKEVAGDNINNEKKEA